MTAQYSALRVAPDEEDDYEMIEPMDTSRFSRVIPLKHPTVTMNIGVSLGTLFDIGGEARGIFKQYGPRAFNQYMALNDKPLPPGAAFNFISKFLELNADPNVRVNVHILSRLDRDVSGFLGNSLQECGLSHYMSLADDQRIQPVFSHELSRYFARKNTDYFDLLLSANEREVKLAQDTGFPAVLVNPYSMPQGYNSRELRIGLDLDRVVCMFTGDPNDPQDAYLENETKTERDGLDSALLREKACIDLAAIPGPLAPFALKLLALREITENTPHILKLCLFFITARTRDSEGRAKNTLKYWGFSDEDLANLVSTADDPKGLVVRNLMLDFFADDKLYHLLDIGKESPRTLRGHVLMDPLSVRKFMKNCQGLGLEPYRIPEQSLVHRSGDVWVQGPGTSWVCAERQNHPTCG